MIVVLLGPPGAGKGTQGVLLAQRLEMPYLASGEIFRRAIAANDSVGQRVRQYVERGFLVPDDITVQVVLEYLDQPAADAGVILDGFPRTKPQAKALDQALAERERKVDHALALHVPTDVLVPRLSGRWLCPRCAAVYHTLTKPPEQPGCCDVCGAALYQRVDDQPDRVERRLWVHQENTLPVVSYYRQRKVLHEIDGNQPVPAVTAALLAALQPSQRDAPTELPSQA